MSDRPQEYLDQEDRAAAASQAETDQNPDQFIEPTT